MQSKEVWKQGQIWGEGVWFRFGHAEFVALVGSRNR